MFCSLSHRLSVAGLFALLWACATASPENPESAATLYRGLDDGDLARMTPVLQRTLESALSGETARWRNDETNRSGSVRPLRTFRTATGYYCREFEELITDGGSNASGVHTACRNDDGIWVIALEPKPPS
jgi:surface antigen